MARVSLTLIGIVIIAAVLLASAGGYVYNTTTTTTGHTQTNTSSIQSKIDILKAQLQTLQAEQGCLATTPVPQKPTGNLTPVLLMKPGTTGIICVVYKTSWSGDPYSYTNDTASVASRYPFGITIGRNNSISHSFTLSAQPDPVTPSVGMKSVTVLYHVTALANSTGFYDYSAPYGYCNTMPMAVGYDRSQVNGSDFPPRPPPHSCPTEPYSPVSVGVSGIGVALVDIPPSRSYMTAPAGSSFCSETTSYYTGGIPCFTYDRSKAYIFNCTAAAATPAGCTVALGTGAVRFNVTVWYPAKNQTFWWANCYYVVSNASGKTPASWQVCIPVAPNSFILATPPGPLT